MLHACGFRMILADSSSPISWRRSMLVSLIGSWKPCTTTASQRGHREPHIGLITARLTRTCLLRTQSLLSGALGNWAVTPPQSPSAPLIILVRCCVQSRRFGNGSMKSRALEPLAIESQFRLHCLLRAPSSPTANHGDPAEWIDSCRSLPPKSTGWSSPTRRRSVGLSAHDAHARLEARRLSPCGDGRRVRSRRCRWEPTGLSSPPPSTPNAAPR